MTRTQVALLVVSALLVGGLVGAGVTRFHLRKEERTARAFHVSVGCQNLLDQIGRLDRKENEEVRRRMESQLALGILESEHFATRGDKVGDMARATLKKLSSHRSDPMYIQEEMSLKQLLDSARNASK